MHFCAYHIVVFIPVLASVLSFDPFSDNVLFDVSWSGPLREVKLTDDGDKESMTPEAVFITSKDNEKYKCLLPSIRNDDEDKEKSHHGPTPVEMLAPLFREDRCSYRLESFWNYELCHGKYIRQFHEDRTAKGTVIQEYFLGKIDIEQRGKEAAKTALPTEAPGDQPKKEMKKIPTRRIDGIDLPYYEVVMGNGTPCDLLNSAPRITHIIYICNPRAQNEIRSVKELQTCEYEVELMTPLLCANDHFRPKEEIINQIQCHSLEDSPREPRSYVSHVEEQIVNNMGPKETKGVPQNEPTPTPGSDQHRKVSPQPDKQLTREFLMGDHCLTGGTGWWRFEFCYGKHVLQYHMEKNVRKTSVVLGSWDKQKHLSWFKKKKNTGRVVSGQVTHLYSEGDVCEEIGELRHVQVKLKCKKSNHLQEVSVYLMEPETCKYIFVVESPILCPLIEHADEHELFPDDVLSLIS